MIVGGDKTEVIKNMKKRIKAGELNGKVEIGDPVLSDEETDAILDRFYKQRRSKIWYYIKSRFAYFFVDIVARKLNKSVKVEGLKNLKGVPSGAIVTSNHFNPLDNLTVRKAMFRKYMRDLYVVSQETNLALPGFFGYLVNNLHIIPLCKGPNYITKTFLPELEKTLKAGNNVLIYPEEEMWFNYRKPRPCKRGAYQFAAQIGVPVIPCFVEMIDTDEPDNEQFNKVKYKVHVLKPIYADPAKTPKENAREMAEQDYQQKVAAYEECYGKKLDYKFSYSDIGGWRMK